MKETIFGRLRRRLVLGLDPEAGTGRLEPGEEAALGTLYVVLTGDPKADVDAYLQRTRRGTEEKPGLLARLRDGLELLQSISRRKCSGKRFEQLDSRARESVVSRLLSGTPSRFMEPRWRVNLKLTHWHIERVLCTPRVRAFRQFVADGIFQDYFSSTAGWAIVGYSEFPGRVRAEWEPCEVLSIHFERDEILLELSDSTFESLREGALSSHDDESLTAVTKSGRQIATFSRAAYNTLTERLEEDGDDLVVRNGARTWRIAQRA